MKEKIVTGFYSALSAAVWFFAFCGILFLIYLLVTGYTRAPSFEVRSAEFAAAEETDEALRRLGESPEGWYTLTLETEIRGSALSPYTYRFTGLHLKTPQRLAFQSVHFTVCTPAPFSKTETANVRAVLYIRHDGDPAELLETLRGAGFAFDRLFIGMGFIEGEILSEMPGFYLNETGVTVRSAL